MLPQKLRGIRFAHPRHSRGTAENEWTGALHLFFIKCIGLLNKFSHLYTQQKNWLRISTSSFICGERGIRTPGTSQFNGFQDRRYRPLSHLSKRLCDTLSFQKRCKDTNVFWICKPFWWKFTKRAKKTRHLNLSLSSYSYFSSIIEILVFYRCIW